MLVAEKVRLTNRITAALKSYYPQVLEWFEDKDTQVFCEFLTRYPDLKLAQATPKAELEQFFKSLLKHVGVVYFFFLSLQAAQAAAGDIGAQAPQEEGQVVRHGFSSEGFAFLNVQRV